MYYFHENAAQFCVGVKNFCTRAKNIELIRKHVKFFTGSDGKISGNGYYLRLDCLIYLPNGGKVGHIYWGGYPHVNVLTFARDLTFQQGEAWLNNEYHSEIPLEKVQKAGFDFTPLIEEILKNNV
jgi:hypothetical protein